MTSAIKYPIGSVSTATMREEDLILTFLDALKALDLGLYRQLRKDYEEIMDLPEADCQEAMYEFCWDTLCNALQNFAATYMYFGPHPGDGADYGFWLSEDFEQQFADDGGLKVSDTSEVPSDYTGKVLHVSDHGNPTLYAANNGKLTEVWSLV